MSTIKRTHSQCIFTPCLCSGSVLFCSALFVLLLLLLLLPLLFSIWRFMCFHFSLLLWFFPTSIHRTNLFQLNFLCCVVFTRFSVGYFIRLLFAFSSLFLFVHCHLFPLKMIFELLLIPSNRHLPPSFHSKQ